jgi:hypothetical protein
MHSQACLSQMSALASGGGVNMLQELGGVLRRWGPGHGGQSPGDTRRPAVMGQEAYHTSLTAAPCTGPSWQSTAASF